jgi:hypothetical protein
MVEALGNTIIDKHPKEKLGKIWSLVMCKG